MWENLGRVIGEYPHLKKLVIKKKHIELKIPLKKISKVLNCLINKPIPTATVKAR